VLEDVSRALEYVFDPATAGAVADVAPGIATPDVEVAIEQALGSSYAVTGIEADAELLTAAREREPEHAPVSRSRSSGDQA
jgi:hypothetical protein